ncbi:MAG: DUF547 domain-containing protein, partial [Cyanobacteriota bacterium]|nr:DUF547 domain-containing protein [Cyanobacteriota bacterium]
PGTAENQSAEAGVSQPFSYEDYATVLSTYVDDQGKVDYAQLKENRTVLDRFNQSLGRVTQEAYESWTEQEKIAFLVNAYNSLTLQAIIENYPTESIRNIPGVWKFLKFQVLGKPMTLDEIEHQVLRKEFNEPRIHMALVCAAMSCPRLLQEPYLGETLDSQLDKNTRVFLDDERNFKIEPEEGKVSVSSIFDWFGQDFEPTYGTEDKFTSFGSKERAVLNFVSNYLEEEQVAKIEQAENFGYLDYDWSLNRQ